MSYQGNALLNQSIAGVTFDSVAGTNALDVKTFGFRNDDYFAAIAELSGRRTSNWEPIPF
jgi:hypothetical protein